MTYNGWTNWETWNAYNWISSDEALYTVFLNQDEISVKAHIEELSYRKRFSPDKIDIALIDYAELSNALQEVE